MYKSGKLWVMAGVMSITIGVAAPSFTLIYADDNTSQSSSTESSSANSSETASAVSTNQQQNLTSSVSSTANQPDISLTTNLSGTKSQYDSVSFSYKIITSPEKTISKGDTITIDVSSQGLNYSTLQLADGSQYFSLTSNPDSNTITLTALTDIKYDGTISANIVGNPTKNDTNTNKTGTYTVTSSLNNSTGTFDIAGDAMTLSVNNTDGTFIPSFGPHVNGTSDQAYADSVGYHNNYSGSSSGSDMYVYNQNAMVASGELWNYKGNYSNLVWSVRTPGYKIDQKTLKLFLGSTDKTSSVNINWDADGEGFSASLPGTYGSWGDQWTMKFIILTNTNSDVVTPTTTVSGTDNGTGQSIIADPNNNIVLNNTANPLKYYQTSNGKFAPYITAQDKSIYSSQVLSEKDILALSQASDQTDGNISDKIKITNYGGFNVNAINNVGTYTITYSVTNSAGNTSSTTSKITVIQNNSTIDAKDSTLTAGPNTKWSAEDNFVSATDQDGNPVDFKNVKVDGSVDTTKAGKYQVTYSYTDASGNVVSKTITVTVVDSKAAIDAKDSTLTAGPNTKWSAEDNFVSATDQDGNPVDFKNIKVDGSVNTTKAGKYQVTYSYTDASGNVVSKTITVTVVDSPDTNNDKSNNGDNNQNTPNSNSTADNKKDQNIVKNIVNTLLPQTSAEIMGLTGILAAIIALVTGGLVFKKRHNKN